MDCGHIAFLRADTLGHPLKPITKTSITNQICVPSVGVSFGQMIKSIENRTLKVLMLWAIGVMLLGVAASSIYVANNFEQIKTIINNRDVGRGTSAETGFNIPDFSN